jgi:hypothetical protein
MKFHLTVLTIFLFNILSACHSQKSIPKIYNNIHLEKDGRMYLELEGTKAYRYDEPTRYSMKKAVGNPAGTDRGIAFDFSDTTFTGYLYYGFIHYDDGLHPLPVYFNKYSSILKGKAHINILDSLGGRFDMIGWEESGTGTIGYRVSDIKGQFIYDGKITFKGIGPFQVVVTVIEGPFINLLGPDRLTISFRTDEPCMAGVLVEGKEYMDKGESTEHVIEIWGLRPDTIYDYSLLGVSQQQGYSFRTAPLPGSRTSFCFAYASDSRSGQGGGERDVYGANAYIMKKIMALTRQQEARFLQFTGDLINGYLTDVDAIQLQYANWKRSVEPFWHYFPVYVGMGNHEALEYHFIYMHNDTPISLKVDRFPFMTESAEAIFNGNFVMPENGPLSEDGASYDPDTGSVDFPSYIENVYHYTYDNVAVIVLNTDYLFASSTSFLRVTGGNLHGYIMDKQLEWLEATLDTFERDENIDHIFVTLHTPAFPNGGHVKDDMWYDGNNGYRPYISGRPLPRGIIERRNDFLELVVNKSSKVVAMLTGDEHNYNRMKITKDMIIHPEQYYGNRFIPGREIYQINNGAAGAPYYAQEETPWSEQVRGFTTQNALLIIHVDGLEVVMKVINPDTLELIDEVVLREK